MQVNFLIAGTQKGGTSALDAYLREHPQICMATKKEVHFFDNEAVFSSGAPDYALYHNSFRPHAGCKVIGEATPIYMYWEPSVPRIWNYNPEMKIIIILRNPIERAYSHWNMERSRDNEHLSFRTAILQEKERLKKTQSGQHRVYSYIHRGYYSNQIRRLWKYFKKQNTLFIRHEDLKYQPVQCLKKITDFLEVLPFTQVEPQQVHKIEYPEPMHPDDQNLLINIFKKEIMEIEQILGWDCSDWQRSSSPTAD